MSKSTWTYRLPQPLKMKPVVFGMKPTAAPGTDVHKQWNSSHMENYEHIQHAVTATMKSPQQTARLRGTALEKIRAEVQSGRPLWALDVIQRMYEDTLHPTPEHFREVLKGAVLWDEPETARDLFALMERQGAIPDDKTLCCWFETCAALRLKDETLKAWNKYCTEFAFLEEGEANPKPRTRALHTLTRDDLYNLPWWKKRWSFDPNVDIPDNHRYNRTREVFSSAAAALTACGEEELSAALFEALQDKLLTTPTPVAEPLRDHQIAVSESENTGEHGVEQLQAKPVRFRIPNIYLFTMKKNTRGPDWVPNHEWVMEDHQVGRDFPKSSRDTEHGDPRFYSNVQFLLYSYEKVLRNSSGANTFAALDASLARLNAALDTFYAEGSEEAQRFPRNLLNFEDVVSAYLHATAKDGFEQSTPLVLHAKMIELCERYSLRATPAMYQAVFKSFTKNKAESDTDRLLSYIRELTATRQEMDLQTHSEILKALVATKSGRGNAYFTKHILRKFRWANENIKQLLVEYRAIGEGGDRNKQKLHCERAFAWCNRYNVGMSEENKQYIEDDYEHIRVQVRTKEELIVWKMRRQHELRNSLTPHMPNPVMDRVTHTLRDGDHVSPTHIQDWVVPYSNAGRSFKWNYSNPHQPEAGSDVRDLTDVNRVRYLPQRAMVSGAVAQERYRPKAMYRPESTHERLHVNRWLEETNQSFPGN